MVKGKFCAHTGGWSSTGIFEYSLEGFLFLDGWPYDHIPIVSPLSLVKSDQLSHYFPITLKHIFWHMQGQDLVPPLGRRRDGQVASL